MTVDMAFWLILACYLAVTVWEWRILVRDIDALLDADVMNLCDTCRAGRREVMASLSEADPIATTVLTSLAWPWHRSQDLWEWLTRTAQPEHCSPCTLAKVA